MLSAGDSGRSVRVGTAASAASGSGIASLSATPWARSSWTLRRLASIRVRIFGSSTLPSSKAKAATMCSRSTSVWLMKNCRAWL